MLSNDQTKLSDEQIKQYHGEGYTCVPHFISQETVSLFLKEINTISQQNTVSNHNKERVDFEALQPDRRTPVRRIIIPSFFGALVSLG